MKGRIKNRLIIALLAVAAVPLTGVGLYSIHTNTAALRELALAAARERAQLKARKVEETLRDLRSDLFFLARSPLLFSLLDELGHDPVQADFWRDKVGQQFLAFLHNKSMYACLGYLDETGQEIVRAEHDGLRSWLVPDGRLENRALWPYFRAAVVLPAGEVHVSSVDRSDEGAHEPLVRYALRVIDRRNQRRGVLVADVFARQLVEVVQPAGLAADGQTSLLSSEGTPLSPVGALRSPFAEPAVAAARERLLAGEPAVLWEEERQLVSWAPVWPALPGTGPLWLLVDVAPRAEVFASVRRFRLLFAGLVAAVVAVALFLSFVLARRVAGPLAELRDGARRIAGGDFTRRLEVRTGDEIQEVAEEFDRMGQALHQLYSRLEERDLAKTEQLQNLAAQLVEREKLAAVGQLAAGVAHEINNPIGVVSMFVQQLLEREDLSPACQDKLRIVERHAERIGRITRGLLDFARAREYRRERLEVGKALEAALAAFGPRLLAAGVEVDRACPWPAAEVVGDEEQLQQVFGNLVLNAVQAMAGGGRLRVEMRRTGAEIVVVFADTGPGIPAEHLDRVFEPFFTTKEVGQGTGLGLAISYGIVKAHGGRMRAGNRPGGGAEFTVVLPAADQARESAR